MSIEDKKSDDPKNPESEKPDIIDLQKQIDALVRGEALPSSRSLRDLVKKPMPTKESGKSK